MNKKTTGVERGFPFDLATFSIDWIQQKLYLHLKKVAFYCYDVVQKKINIKIKILKKVTWQTTE